MKGMLCKTENLAEKLDFQIQAVAALKAEIFGTDKKPRTKYIQDFTAEFAAFERVASYRELLDSVRATRIVFIGDYHAVRECQEFQARLLEDLSDRPVVVALETFYGCQQRALDDWMARQDRGRPISPARALRPRMGLRLGCLSPDTGSSARARHPRVRRRLLPAERLAVDSQAGCGGRRKNRGPVAPLPAPHRGGLLRGVASGEQPPSREDCRAARGRDASERHDPAEPGRDLLEGRVRRFRERAGGPDTQVHLLRVQRDALRKIRSLPAPAGDLACARPGRAEARPHLHGLQPDQYRRRLCRRRQILPLPDKARGTASSSSSTDTRKCTPSKSSRISRRSCAAAV